MSNDIFNNFQINKLIYSKGDLNKLFDQSDLCFSITIVPILHENSIFTNYLVFSHLRDENRYDSHTERSLLFLITFKQMNLPEMKSEQMTRLALLMEKSLFDWSNRLAPTSNPEVHR